MRIVMTRQSVSMGDDVDAPHEGRSTHDGTVTLERLLGVLARHLPSMPGARWEAYRGWNQPDGEPIADFSTAWSGPRFRDDDDRHRPIGSLVPDGEELRLYFRYHSRG